VSAVTDGPPAAPAAPARRRRWPLAATLALGVAGAALVLLAAGHTWERGRAAFQQGTLAISATGREVTAVPSALALVGLAALVAIFAVRGRGRITVTVLLALSGAGAVAACVLGARDHGALDDAASRASGLSGTVATGVTHTAWPWVAALGGLFLAVAGLAALVQGRNWPGMSSRYDAPGGRTSRAPAAAPPEPEDRRPEDMWQALDRGEDPTER
jgi:uncharacterized membrane protein (TIGR02234 family)